MNLHHLGNFLYHHPLLESRIDRGLSGYVRIDHLIGLVEEHLHAHGESSDPALRDAYQNLRILYPVHFRTGPSQSINSSDKLKNPAYKALNH